MTGKAPWKIEQKLALKRAKGTSCIYFVTVSSSNRTKIGYSADVGKRLALLSTGSPQAYILDVVYPGTRADESALHRRFKAYRLKGEWFGESTEIAKYIHEAAQRPDIFYRNPWEVS